MDPETLTELLTTTLPGLRRALNALVSSKQDVDDLLQDAVTTLLTFHSEQRIAQPCDAVFRSFLRTAAVRAAKNAKRKRRPEPIDPEVLGEQLWSGPTQGAQVDLADASAKLAALFSKLPERVREPLLDLMADRSHAEIAAMRSRKEGASWSSRTRAKQAARRNDELERCLRQFAAANGGHYGNDGEFLEAASARPAAYEGDEARLTPVRVGTIRWHRDGFVRATVVMSEPESEPMLGLLLLRRPGSGRVIASAPLALFADVDGDGRTGRIEAFLGVPSMNDRSGDGIELPARLVALAFAATGPSA